MGEPRWGTGKHSVPFILFVLLIAFLLILSSLYLLNNERSVGWRQVFVLFSMMTFAACYLVYYRMHWGTIVQLALALDISVSAAYGFVFIGGNFPEPLFLGIAGLMLFLKRNQRSTFAAWYSFLLVYLIVILAVEVHLQKHIDEVYYFVNMTFVVFASIVGSLIHYYQEARNRTDRLYRDLEKSHEQLRDYNREIEVLTASRERMIVAREIHDTVGHTLTALIIQLQATRKLQESSDLSRSLELLVKSEELARYALQEVRLSIRTIRDDSMFTYFNDSLSGLARDFSEITGMDIQLDIQGDLSVLSNTMKFTMFRIIQESLTNAKKHGDAPRVHVQVKLVSDHIELVITDDGEGVDSILPGSGLMNMEERAQEQDGTLEYTSAVGQGFQVRATFPKPPRLLKSKGEHT